MYIAPRRIESGRGKQWTKSTKFRQVWSTIAGLEGKKTSFLYYSFAVFIIVFKELEWSNFIPWNWIFS